MNRLKLMALDADDLSVISAHTQDAALKIGNIRYSAADHRVVVEINRFVWENAEQPQRNRSFERRLSVVHFARVNAVRAAGLDQRNRDGVLALLAIRFLPFDADNDDPSGEIELVFAGDGSMRLLVECIEAQITDLDASWETFSRPKHDTGDQDWQ